MSLCSCSKHSAKKKNEMTHIVRDSFEKVMKMLENRYGALKVISIERGEGSFGVAISVSTVKDDTTLIIKT